MDDGWVNFDLRDPKPELIISVRPKTPTTISCSVSPDRIIIGDSTTVSGTLSTSVSGKTIVLTYINPDGSNLTRTTITKTGGSFADYYEPDMIGSWSVIAEWEGDSTYAGSSSQSASFEVLEEAIATTISCFVSQSKVTEGKSITISGEINPAVSGATVIVTFTKPDDQKLAKPTSTNVGGNYELYYTPTEIGHWSVNSSWAGDSVHEGSFSLSKSFTVEEKPFFETLMGQATILIAIIVVSVIISIALRRRRRHPRESRSSEKRK